MRRLALVTILIAVAPLALADRKIHKTLPLAANGHVVVDTHNGSVSIATWSQPTIDVEARIEATMSTRDEDVEKTNVKITGSGDTVRIESDYDDVPSRNRWFGSTRELPPIHYTISMPATARLDISGHNARVRVSGMRNDVDVDSHNGAVELVDLDGAASIETHNGDISVGFTRFAKPSRIETHNGAVVVRVPADARLHVDASGHNLNVDSELGVATTRVSDSHYSGDVNGGGPELRFEAHNGSLKLRKR